MDSLASPPFLLPAASQRLIGYARVSTDEQHLDLQRNTLRDAGCSRIFVDSGISGTVHERPGLVGAMAECRNGDVLVVWRLDRLGRSLPHLIETVTALGAAGIDFRSLTESIDTATASGRLSFHLFGSLAQFERELIAERTKAGLRAARQRGKALGRPKRLQHHQVTHAANLIAKGEQTVAGAAAILGVGRNTLGRALKRLETRT
ncbi:recombinase family protein [Aurantimonas litoralis]|nr:recombinase family protein [Aurantimonas litoralis]